MSKNNPKCSGFFEFWVFESSILALPTAIVVKLLFLSSHFCERWSAKDKDKHWRKKKQKQNTKHKGRTPLIDNNKIVIIFHEHKWVRFLSFSLAVKIYKSWIYVWPEILQEMIEWGPLCITDLFQPILTQNKILSKILKCLCYVTFQCGC